MTKGVALAPAGGSAGARVVRVGVCLVAAEIEIRRLREG